MKKIFIIISMILMLCGCGNTSNEEILKDVKKKVQDSKSYKLTGHMEIINDEETFMYSLESYYLKDDFYKIILVNQTNEHKQIILKENDNIFVITPALNKSFKFQSDWPNNSSQAYLLGSIVKDIDKDNKREIINEGKIIIKSSVNYPNNPELKYQKVYLNSRHEIEKVEVYDDNNIIKIKVVFDEINLKANLKKDDFNLKEYIKEENDTNKVDNSTPNADNDQNGKCADTEDETCKNEVNNNQAQSNSGDQETANIENIIYPLYIPSNTYLTSSETIETDSGNRIILTFSGEKNFVLIEETTKVNGDMEIIPVYGEPVLLSETIGALSANSLSWDSNNISYYLASTELTLAEMKSIADSLGNEKLVLDQK